MVRALIEIRMGTSNFKLAGSLRDWSAANNCSNIIVPTLVINGVEEGASDAAVAPFISNIPDVKWVKMKGSTHMPMYEEKEVYLSVIVDFLKM
jgi:pimeloyl-ACP methyl ester carboxylesterase